MTPKQVNLVQNTFEMLMPIVDLVSALFYGRLFELEPKLRPLFRGDVTEQGKKLMAMLAVAVQGLDALDEIRPTVQQLGRSHVHYGAKPAHYAIVGEALFWTLSQGLGESFTKETEEAWRAAYALLAGIMQEAAVGVELILSDK